MFYLCYMDNMLFKYIEYLLPQYNCVIVPNFGGFVVNMEPAYSNEDGTIAPPSYRISFNQDLTYNDGLLASNIQQAENITYEAACTQIKKCVEGIRLRLVQNKILHCGNLGKLTLNDNNLSFAANNPVMHPYLMGLTPVHIPLLAELDNERIRERRSLNLRYVIGTAAAAAVALLLFMGPSINVGNTTDTSNRQQANFLSTLAKNNIYTVKNVKPEEKTADIAEHFNGENNAGTPEVNNLKSEDTDKLINNYNSKRKEDYNMANIGAPHASRTYYIIVGGEESKYRADKLLSKIQSADFPTANIVESADRYRIYVSAFDNKSDAEEYLEKFRTNNPRYKTAWLFSKRN